MTLSLDYSKHSPLYKRVFATICQFNEMKQKCMKLCNAWFSQVQSSENQKGYCMLITVAF